MVKKLQPLTWARAEGCSVIWIFWELPDFFRCLNVRQKYSCILTYSGQLVAVIDHKATFFCPFWSYLTFSEPCIRVLTPSLLSFVENNKQKPQKQISKSTFGYSLLQKKYQCTKIWINRNYPMWIHRENYGSSWKSIVFIRMSQKKRIKNRYVNKWSKLLAFEGW